MDYEDILYEADGAKARITINRPDKLNAFRARTCEELIDALHRAGWDDGIGVIVLAGAGDRAFSTGGDQSVKDAGYDGRGVIGLPVEELQSLIRLDHPRIVKVHDVGEHDGMPFAVLQYLAGGSLRDKQEDRAGGTRLPQVMPWLTAVAEGLDFLRWLLDDHFTFLGYREYDFHGSGGDAVARIRPDCGLGILRNPDRAVFDGLRNLGQLPEDVRAFVRQPDLLRITKSNVRSTVHRPVHLDTVAVKRMDDKGRVLGELVSRDQRREEPVLRVDDYPVGRVTPTDDTDVADSETAEQLRAVMAPVAKDLRVLMYQGAGHWIQMERAAEVNAALLEFLR